MDITNEGAQWTMCDAEGTAIQPVMQQMVKDSMAQEIGTLGHAPPPILNCPDENLSLADFCPVSEYFRIDEVDYSDPNLSDVLGDGVPTEDNRDTTQKTFTFHPELLTAYDVLNSSKQRWADCEEPTPEELEKAESEVLDLAAMRAGAIEHQGQETVAAKLL